MDSNFSNIEMRMLRNMLSSSTDTEIALVLDRPVEEVSAVINRITGNTPRALKVRRTRKARTGEPKRRGRPKSAAPKTVKTPRAQKRKEEKKREISMVVSRVSAQKKAEQKRYATKVVDYAQMQRVRIDHKTWIYLKPGQTPEKARKAYLKRLQESKSNSFNKDLI